MCALHCTVSIIETKMTECKNLREVEVDPLKRRCEKQHIANWSRFSHSDSTVCDFYLLHHHG